MSASSHDGQLIAELQGGSPLSALDDGLIQRLECLVTERAVVAGRLDAQQASVGLEADLPQSGEVV